MVLPTKEGDNPYSIEREVSIMAKTVMTILNHETDVWECKEEYDRLETTDFFKLLEGISDMAFKCISDQRIFNKDDAEHMCIAALFLMDPEYIHIVSEVKGLSYSIKLLACMGRELVCAEPDPIPDTKARQDYFKKRGVDMLDPRDRIDYKRVIKDWCEKDNVSLHEIWLTAGFLHDMARYYLDGRIV